MPKKDNDMTMDTTQKYIEARAIVKADNRKRYNKNKNKKNQ